jgi:hypothetical protein
MALLAVITRTAVAAQAASATAAAMRYGVRIDSAAALEIEHGAVQVRVLPTQDQRDVAVFGVVRLGVSRDVYLRRILDFRNWLRTPTRIRLGIFSDPAVPADVGELVVSRDDASELKDCRAGDCTTKLSAAEMMRVQMDVDWSARDVQARVTSLARQRIVRYVDAYRDLGNAAMPVYDDRPSVRASDSFLAVLAQSQYLNQAVPAIANYLRTFPRGRPGGVSDVIYWSEDATAHLRPILSVTHTVVFTPPDVAGVTLVASKQIYANHYFEAAIEVMNVIDRDAIGDAASTYLVVERRFRFDNLPRGGILNIRGRVVNGLRDQLRDDLMREQSAVSHSATAH